MEGLVDREPAGRERLCGREQSLELGYEGVVDGARGTIYRPLFDRESYIDYERMALWVQGRPTDGGEQPTFFVAFGIDTLNVYEYAAPLQDREWEEHVIEFDEFTRLKEALLDSLAGTGSTVGTRVSVPGAGATSGSATAVLLLRTPEVDEAVVVVGAHDEGTGVPHDGGRGNLADREPIEDDDLPRRFAATGHVGFYCRVLTEGDIGAGDAITDLSIAANGSCCVLRPVSLSTSASSAGRASCRS